MNQIYKDTITKNIRSQTEMILDLLNGISSKQEDIIKQLNEIKAKEVMIKALESDLSRFPSTILDDDSSKESTDFVQNIIPPSSEIKRQTLVEKVEPALSPEYTLHLISISEEPNGPQANDLVNAFSDSGIKTYNKQVLKLLEGLEKQGLIYQTNPDNSRGKRYKIKR